MFSVPIKKQISMLRLIALQGVRAYKNVAHLQLMYRDPNPVVELLLNLENKPRIMQNNVDTQHKHIYSLYIGSLCNIAIPMARLTCIVTIYVFVKI